MKYKRINEVLLNWNSESADNDSNIIQTKTIKDSIKIYRMYNLDDDEDSKELKDTIRSLSCPEYYYDPDDEEGELIEAYERYHLFGDQFSRYSYWGTGTEEEQGPFSDQPYEWMNTDWRKLIPQGYWEFLAKKFNELKETNTEDIENECYTFCDLLSSITYTFDKNPLDFDFYEEDIEWFFKQNDFTCIAKDEDSWDWKYLFQGKNTEDLVLVCEPKPKKTHLWCIMFLAYGIPPRM